MLFNPLGRQRRITQPTLVVQGTADQVVDPGNAEVLAGLLPDARLQRFDGAGHLLYWEQPKRFVRIVTDFLTDPASAAHVPAKPPAGPVRKGDRVRPQCACWSILRLCVKRSDPMVRSITKDTVLCRSLAGQPSNIGTRFHNFLYAELELDLLQGVHDHRPGRPSPGSGPGHPRRGLDALQGGLHRACGLDGSAEGGSVNTIVNTDGQLRAYNTTTSIVKLLADHQVPAFAVLGRGGWQAVVAALRDGFHGQGARANARTGAALADQYGYLARPSEAGHSCWSTRSRSDVGWSRRRRLAGGARGWWTPPRRSWTWSPCQR